MTTGGAEYEEIPMEQNKTIQINWATFNMPTILSIAGILWYTAIHTQTVDSRLDTIELSRAATRIDIVKRIENLESDAAKTPNIEYRMTTLEQKVEGNNLAVNARIDRQTDALQDIRTSIGDLSTKFSVLGEKIDNAFPLKKSELDFLPREYQRNGLNAPPISTK